MMRPAEEEPRVEGDDGRPAGLQLEQFPPEAPTVWEPESVRALLRIAYQARATRMRTACRPISPRAGDSMRCGATALLVPLAAAAQEERQRVLLFLFLGTTFLIWVAQDLLRTTALRP